jgi:hypothetical protein
MTAKTRKRTEGLWKQTDVDDRPGLLHLHPAELMTALVELLRSSAGRVAPLRHHAGYGPGSHRAEANTKYGYCVLC